MKNIYAHSIRSLITLLCMMLLGVTLSAQNTSPVYVIEFNKIMNGIMDEGKLQKNQLTDYDDNPVCLVKVKAQGFDEATLQKLIFVPRNIMMMHKAYENGEYRLYVSSKKPGSILIKYQGEYEFKLPYNLEPKKIYELILGMETATLNIISTPDDAAIYIDGEKVGVGHGSKAVSIGAEHKYKVECEDYITEENTVMFTQGGKSGYRVTGTNGRSLFLPAAGYFGGTSLRYAGSCGYYWSSSLYSSSPNYAYYMYFNSGNVNPQYDYNRYFGYTVRPVR